MTLRFLPALLLLLTTGAYAQTPVASAPAPGLRTSPLTYSLNAGAMFAGRYGSATYLSPQANYQLTNRLSLFGGVTYVRTMPGAALLRTAEGTVRSGYALGTNHYLIQGGGTYALSPRLSLTGSAWKDLTPSQPGFSVNPYAGFGNLGQGINLRADYHITEHFSVSGGVRVSQGASAPGLGSMYGSPLGY